MEGYIGIKMTEDNHSNKKKLRDLKVSVTDKIQNQEQLQSALEEQLAWLMPSRGPYRILRQSIDARRRQDLHFVYTVEVANPGEHLELERFELETLTKTPRDMPIIVGTGPAGIFAALRLIERGIPCRVFERGSECTDRMKSINRFWRYGELDPRNNVCFGEGGAGLYSDGKLITRIKSTHIPYVLNKLVQFGAPAEIQWLSNPHVGSDKIRRIIPVMREYLKSKGCVFYFNSRVDELIFESSHAKGVRTEQGETFYSPFVILATGHSAEDILREVQKKGIQIEGKSFALGLRVEHDQQVINKIQYREHEQHPLLGPANYKLTHHDDKTNIGVYSFCMCPGGFVLSSGTEPNGIVCNGMSNYHRNSKWANAALVVSIDHESRFGKDPMKGLDFRNSLEKRAFEAVKSRKGTKEIPAQSIPDFLKSKTGLAKPLKGSSPSGALNTPLHELLPKDIYSKLCEGIETFDRKMKGFIHPDALLYGVETRTSCPVRIVRDEKTLQSISHPGLFPAGEGAGYAGGITSAACDGVRIADCIFETLKSGSINKGVG